MIEIPLLIIVPLFVGINYESNKLEILVGFVLDGMARARRGNSHLTCAHGSDLAVVAVCSFAAKNIEKLGVTLVNVVSDATSRFYRESSEKPALAAQRVGIHEGLNDDTSLSTSHIFADFFGEFAV